MKKATTVFITLTIAAIAIWDVYVIISGGVEVSISHTMIEWSYKYPVFTFLMGFTMGHLFWRMRDTKVTQQISASTREEVDSTGDKS